MLFCDWSMFSNVGPPLAAGKKRQIQSTQVAFGTILQDHRRLPVRISWVKITAIWSLKRVTMTTSEASYNLAQKKVKRFAAAV
jgi:hypothetical protein